MTTPYSNNTFRRRTIGRAASPPTWACYEQIHGVDDDEDSLSESESESGSGSGSDSGEDVGEGEGEEVGGEHGEEHADDAEEREMGGAGVEDGVAHDMEMDVDAAPLDSPSSPVLPGEMPPPEAPTDQANVKGKQRAVDPIPPPSRRSHPKKQRKHREKRERVYTLRPILTIQRSQGFVWNQDLFVPPYIKDRYVASTSPPGSGFVSTSVSSTNSALTDYDNYEVEVVEIRVQEGEYAGIIPRP